MNIPPPTPEDLAVDLQLIWDTHAFVMRFLPLAGPMPLADPVVMLGVLLRRLHQAETRCAQQATALDELVELQAHYAKLLNCYDEGKRHQFKSGAEWMARLRETGKLPPAMGGD